EAVGALSTFGGARAGNGRFYASLDDTSGVFGIWARKSGTTGYLAGVKLTCDSTTRLDAALADLLPVPMSRELRTFELRVSDTDEVEVTVGSAGPIDATWEVELPECGATVPIFPTSWSTVFDLPLPTGIPFGDTPVSVTFETRDSTGAPTGSHGCAVTPGSTCSIAGSGIGGFGYSVSMNSDGRTFVVSADTDSTGTDAPSSLGVTFERDGIVVSTDTGAGSFQGRATPDFGDLLATCGFRQDGASFRVLPQTARPNGRILFGGTVQAHGAQFGEILIDGVVWELE
ncbi:MAG: hypothetical protein KC656_24820, partial [Myxococcales bacterium]|nr:hypothetical protein [Myxococcales bacterium]